MTLRITRESETSASRRRLVANGGTDDRNVFEKVFDPAVEPPSRAVVDAVGFVHNTDPADLRPLGELVDTEALDSVLTGYAGDGIPAEFTFYYQELEVTVTSNGHLWLQWDD